jgi:hypothetical protein
MNPHVNFHATGIQTIVKSGEPISRGNVDPMSKMSTGQRWHSTSNQHRGRPLTDVGPTSLCRLGIPTFDNCLYSSCMKVHIGVHFDHVPCKICWKCPLIFHNVRFCSLQCHSYFLITDGFPTNIQRSNTVHWSARRLSRRRPDGMFDRWADIKSV